MTVPSYGETDDLIMDVPPVAPGARQNAQTSWTQQQVGTPVMPPKEYTPYNGYAKTGRQTKPAGGNGTQGADSSAMDETRRYTVPQHAEGMKKTPAPGDQTIVLPEKKMTRAEKASARKAEKEARKAKKEEQESRWKKAPVSGENPYAGQQGYPGVMPAGTSWTSQGQVQPSKAPTVIRTDAESAVASPFQSGSEGGRCQGRHDRPVSVRKGIRQAIRKTGYGYNP